uniref:glutaminyl-peptide cyclotransferase n=1 Tax=Fibrobacter succinogenes TaxID=833 RepID=UPI0013D49244
EIVGDTLYANIWQTGAIAVIELPSGRVSYYLDLSRKVAELKRKYPDIDVLNGIAYDGKNLWVTGKNWPQIYKLK